MGPLVPDMISNNMNFVVALLIGMAFGAILEQAGFSSPKKLVGLFYGYDFTVLRVFFTAGVVAMVGLMGFAHFGLIDINLIFINPAFIWSALVGGLIMGLGFVIGGFCPGTSVCAAAIGKIDAFIFIGGSFLGTIIFTESYPQLKSLYTASDLGIPRVYESLGISQNLFAFLMVFVAAFAFWMTSMIEKKVNKQKIVPIRLTAVNIGIVAVTVLLAASALLFSERREKMSQLVKNDNFVTSYTVNTMSADEFALCLIKSQECDKLEIFDFRTEEEYKKMSLPKSTLFSFDNLFEKEPGMLLHIKNKQKVFVANDEISERKMAVAALELGYTDIHILQGGLDHFKKQILDYQPIENPTSLQQEYKNRFRTKAKEIIPILIKNNKPKPPVKKKIKRAIGGC